MVRVSRRSIAGQQGALLDMEHATTLGAWLPHLNGVDAVVNCAGILQDGPRKNTANVHHLGADALFAACE